MGLDLPTAGHGFGAGGAAGRISVPPWLFITLLFSGSVGLANMERVVLFAGKMAVPGRLSLSSVPSIPLVLVGCCGFWLEFLRGLMCCLVVSFSDDTRHGLQPLVPIHPERRDGAQCPHQV